MQIKIQRKDEYFDRRCNDCGKAVHKIEYTHDVKFNDILPWYYGYVSDMFTSDYDPKTGLTIEGALIVRDNSDVKLGIVTFTATCPALIKPEHWQYYITVKIAGKNAKKFDAQYYLTDKITSDLQVCLSRVAQAYFE